MNSQTSPQSFSLLRPPSALTVPSVATIGFFDGVHLGHRFLIDQVLEAARQRGLASTVITFPVHPRRVMQASFQPRLLLSCEEKVERLALTGVSQCFMLDFTPQLARLTAREFMTLLRDRHHVRALVIGYDHRFGHDRLEGLPDYVRYGRELGMEVIPALPLDLRTACPSYPPPAVSPADHPRSSSPSAESERPTISSSLIRRHLQEGDVSAAAGLLGYNYFLSGNIVDGHHVGRTLGYPTANLRLDCPDRVIPADGVYAVRLSISPLSASLQSASDSPVYGGMMNIGRRPTLDNGPDRSLEVHVFGLHADLYRHAMRVSFVSRLRPECKFSSLHDLAAQLRADEQQARRILSQTANTPASRR